MSVIIAYMKHTITFIIPAIVISEPLTPIVRLNAVPTKVQGTNLYEELKDVITDMYVSHTKIILINVTKFMWVRPNKRYVWFL